MIIDPLPLKFIGLFFTIVPLAAITGGALLLRLLHRQGKLTAKNLKNYSVWNDIILLGVWGVGFLGGFGVLNKRAWGATFLEYFCWVLIVLTIINALTRLKVLHDDHARDRDPTPINWVAAIGAALLTVVPIVALCGATIYTLKTPEVQQVLDRQPGPAQGSAVPL